MSDTRDIVPRLTVSQRLRGTLKRLFHAEGHGTAAHLAKFSADRPHGTRISTQNLSYFLHNTSGRVNPLGLDDLDDIADYFRVSIAELVGLKPQDLSGDEQRLLWSFRALPDRTREHFLALLESASVSQKFVTFRQEKRLQTKAELAHTPTTSGGIDAGVGSATAVPLAAQVAVVAAELTDLAHRIATIEASAADRVHAPTPRDDPPARR